MKQYISFACLIIFVLMGSILILSSCSNDDEKDSKDTIIGTWYLIDGFDDDQYLDFNTFYRFEEGGTGAYIVDSVPEMSHFDKFDWIKTGTNRYQINYIFSDDEPEEVFLDGDIIDVKGDGYVNSYRKK